MDVTFDKTTVNKDVIKDASKRRSARRDVKEKFEERYTRVMTNFFHGSMSLFSFRYKTGKNKWFFTKLRF